MKAFKSLQTQWRKIAEFDRPLKLFLSIPFIYGMYFAGKGLFFNFYILEMGFDKEFLGLANSMTPMATLILAFPLGVLTDRIGRKNAVLIGMIVQAVSYFVMLLVGDGTLLLVTLFAAGIGETLYFVSSTPLLTRLTNKENRVFVFSLRAAMFTFSGVVGSYVGGRIPVWLEGLFNIPLGTVDSYKGVLFASFVMIVISLIPVAMIPRGDGEAEAVRAKLPGGQAKRSVWTDLKNILRKKIVWQLFIPNLFVGLGAALMVPYINIFLKDTFSITDQTLGTLFSIAMLVTGTSTLFSPWLAKRLGNRIRALVATQGFSLVFLLMLGFSPWLGAAVIGFWGRNALMNMAQPLFNAFGMEQVDENEQGTLSSLLSLSWQTGWALMPAVSGFIQKQYGFTPIFIATAVMYAIATILIWTFFRNAEPNERAREPLQVNA